jgi:glycosyltransferase involved in cell wall biosynthesis
VSTAPTVSVIVPAYNCAAYLPRAIESVLAQSFTDFDLFVVDDGSTDDTAKVLERYSADTRVRFVPHTHNTGPSATRNRGIRLSAGEFVAFLDADDEWARDKLEVQVTALASAEADVCGVGCRWLMPGGTEVIVSKQHPYSGDGLYRELLFKNTIPGSSSSILVRRKCFDDVGLFDEELRAVEDRDMWLRLASRFRFAFIGEPLVSINRRRTDSAIRDPVRMAFGREGFLRKRERDVPPRFRRLLPEVRRTAYLSIANQYRAAGDRPNARRYGARAILTSGRLDATLWKALRVTGASLLPGVARRRGDPADPAPDPAPNLEKP